jgi:AcrR family transcriptional regulator
LSKPVLDKLARVNEDSFMVMPMLSTEEPASQAGDRRRQRVLDAALDLFSERTWEGTNVPQIAERAGVAVGTIYRYFENKEALGSAVYTEAKRAFAEMTVTTQVRQAEPLQALRLVWRGQLAFAMAYPEAFAFLEHQQHAGYLNSDALAVAGQLNADLCSIIRAGQAAGVVREGDPKVLLAMVYGAFVGVTRLARALAVPLEEFDCTDIERAASALLGLPETTLSTENPAITGM